MKYASQAPIQYLDKYSEYPLADSNTTQNNWAGKLALFLNDAWSRGANWAMKGFGYANDTNADREAELAIELVNNLLANARREVIDEAIALIRRLRLTNLPYDEIYELEMLSKKPADLATLREEEAK